MATPLADAVRTMVMELVEAVQRWNDDPKLPPGTLYINIHHKDGQFKMPIMFYDLAIKMLQKDGITIGWDFKGEKDVLRLIKQKTE